MAQWGPVGSGCGAAMNDTCNAAAMCRKVQSLSIYVFIAAPAVGFNPINLAASQAGAPVKQSAISRAYSMLRIESVPGVTPLQLNGESFVRVP